MSSIYGIGCDIVSIARIEKAFGKKESWSAVFTPLEITYFERHQFPWPHIAGHFAAKEAVAKALGTGFRKGTGFCDIEIGHDALGKPTVRLSDQLRLALPAIELLVTISHEKEYAVAYAIVQNLRLEKSLTFSAADESPWG